MTVRITGRRVMDIKIEENKTESGEGQENSENGLKKEEDDSKNNEQTDVEKQKLDNAEAIATKLLKQEFRDLYNTKGTQYVDLPEDVYELTRTNLIDGLKTIEQMLSRLPFGITYAFLCLLSTKRIHFFDYSLEEYFTLIDEIHKRLTKVDYNAEHIQAFENAIRRITYK